MNTKEILASSEKNRSLMTHNENQFKGEHFKNFKNYFIHNNMD